MARVALAAAVVALTAALGTGCGGSAAACDDAAFRHQSEELYVAIATAQNAAVATSTPALLADLRKGVHVLSDHVEANPPCAGELASLAEKEREGIRLLESALERATREEDAVAKLNAAIAVLSAVEEALR